MTKIFFHIFMLFFVNDEWPMTNDKWKSVISYFFFQWRMTNDEWQMTNEDISFHIFFQWRMTNDEWQKLFFFIFIVILSMTNDEWRMTKETLKETFSKETFWGRTKEQRNMKDLVKEKETFSSSPAGWIVHREHLANHNRQNNTLLKLSWSGLKKGYLPVRLMFKLTSSWHTD